MNIKKPKKWILPLACYATALVVWLGAAGLQLWWDTARQQNGEIERTPPWLEDFQLEGVERRSSDDGRQYFLTRGTDPRMVYAPGEAFRATTLTFKATPHRPAGEIVLYYTDTDGEVGPDAGFDNSKMLWAEETPDGSWYFDLRGRSYTGLRLDPGTTSGIIWSMDRLVLNDSKRLLHYFVPDARIIFLLLMLPGFAAVVLREVAGALRMYRLRGRTK